MKIFLIFLILLQINIHAWQLIIRDYHSNSQSDEIYYYDINKDTIEIKRLYNGQGSWSSSNTNSDVFWRGLQYIRTYNGNNSYNTIQNINNQLKNNVNILDAFYRLAPQLILNYYYNPNNNFNFNRIDFKNYELLTDSDGLIVASIVDGKWQGLYDNDSKIRSGRLFDLNGKLAYIDGDFVGLYYEIFNFDVIPINLKDGVKIVLGISISFALGFILLRAVMSFSKYDPFKVRKIDYKKDYDK